MVWEEHASPLCIMQHKVVAVGVFVVVFFCASSGITHWRIQEELIKAVPGHTIITAQEDKVCNSCSKKDETEVTVYDKELSIIIKSVHASKQGELLINFNCCKIYSFECQ